MNRENSLYLYQWKEEKGANEGDNRSVHLLSTHQNWQIKDDIILSGRLGTKRVNTALENQPYAHQVWITDARLIYLLDDRLDLDFRSGLLMVDAADSLRWSVGMGAYYLVATNLRAGLYYNFIGFNDKDLDAGQRNTDGIHMSLQFKFDESILGWFES